MCERIICINLNGNFQHLHEPETSWTMFKLNLKSKDALKNVQNFPNDFLNSIYH